MTDVRIPSFSPEMRAWKFRHLGCAALDSFALDASPPVPSPFEHVTRRSSETAEQLIKRLVLCQVVLKRLDCEHWVRVWATAVLRLEHWMTMVWAKQTLYAETESTDSLVGLADDCLALVATRSQANISPHGTT